MPHFNGALFGLLPIGWIVLNVIFLYQLTKQKGYFQVLQDNIANVTADRRLQLLLIAFAFGAFFEGAAGFGTPVAVTGAILIGLGFLSAGRFGSVLDREHCTRRLWRARHAGDHACRRDRVGCKRPLRDGGAPASVLLAFWFRSG